MKNIFIYKNQNSQAQTSEGTMHCIKSEKAFYKTKLIACIVLLLFTLSVNNKLFAQTDASTAKKLIVGTWILDGDDENGTKEVYTEDGKCYEYFEGKLETTSTYTISNASRQCGINVRKGNNIYLKRNYDVYVDTMCDEIYITYNSLYLSRIDMGANGVANYNRVLTGICDPASPNYNPTACELSKCDPASPNYDVLACERSRCDATSPNYDPAKCDPAFTDPAVAAYYTFNDLLGHSPNGGSLTLQDGATITDSKLVLGGMYTDDDDNMFSPHATAVNSPSLNPQKQITVAAKIKPQDFYGCGNDAIVNKPFTSHTTPYYQYHLGIRGSYYSTTNNYYYTFSFWASISGQPKAICSYPLKWTPGQWYTVVGTYDGSNIKLFVNGTLIASKAATGNIDSYNTDLFIGKHGNADYSIPAEYEWVKIYNRGLTDAEVIGLSGR